MALAAGCSTAGTPMVGTTAAVTPGQEMHPLVEGWERFFTVNWQRSERHGTPILSGRVQNNWGDEATNVQLLVDGLDPQGKVVTQKVVWLGDDVPPFDSTYFEVPVQSAPSYRVSVFAYDWFEGGADGPARR